jgi:hypothetical protein
MPPKFQSSEYGHQYGLRQSTSITVITVAVLATHDCGANGSLGSVVAHGHVIVPKKSQKLIPILFNSLG